MPMPSNYVAFPVSRLVVLLAALAFIAPAVAVEAAAGTGAPQPPARAAIMRLAPIFQDHAVLQRDLAIPVWGTTEPGRVVVVRLAEQVVRLRPLPAGGPHELSVSDGRDTVRAADLLVGEVWYCAGQSNMAWTLSQTPQQLPDAECDLPRIRLLDVGTPARVGRQSAINGRWAPANARSLADFSAVAGWFGRSLHRELDVPVGLIAGAWGGARIQAWISREALMRERFGIDEVRAYDAFVHLGADVPRTAWERDMRALDTGNAGLAAGWAAPGFDDAGWATMPVPSRWQDHGHATSGVFWFRRTVEIPTEWRGQEFELCLGAVDKHDDT